MSSFVRASKFKHVYCDAPRIDATVQNLRVSNVTGEHNYIKANPHYFAVGVQVQLQQIVFNLLHADKNQYFQYI
jgi:hypothetical protein